MSYIICKYINANNSLRKVFFYFIYKIIETNVGTLSSLFMLMGVMSYHAGIWGITFEICML